VQVAAVVLAVTLAFVRRRADLVGLSAACAAVIIALQLGIEHWFYLYIPWFFPLVAIALLGGREEPRPGDPKERGHEGGERYVAGGDQATQPLRVVASG